MIEIRIPFWDELDGDERGIRGDMGQDVAEFVHCSVLLDKIKANDSGQLGYCEARYDGVLVGTSSIKSRAHYPHLIHHGEIQVSPQYRRLRCGTSMYACQAICALLEGRRLLEDHIVWDQSPWMTETFLPSMRYTLVGLWPQRTRGFLDLHIWNKPTWEMQDILSRVPIDTKIQWLETEGTETRWEANLKRYGNYCPQVGEALQEIRAAISKHSTPPDDRGRRTLTVWGGPRLGQCLTPGFPTVLNRATFNYTDVTVDYGRKQ